MEVVVVEVDHIHLAKWLGRVSSLYRGQTVVEEALAASVTQDNEKVDHIAVKAHHSSNGAHRDFENLVVGGIRIQTPGFLRDSYCEGKQFTEGSRRMYYRRGNVEGVWGWGSVAFQLWKMRF